MEHTKLKAKYKHNASYLSLQQLRYYPSLLVQSYTGSYHQWKNQFLKPIITQIKGNVKVPFSFVNFYPYFLWTKIKHPIYFNKQYKPAQDEKHAYILSNGFKINFCFWQYIHMDNNFMYTDIFGPAKGVYDMPKYYLNTKIYYANQQLFNQKLMLEGGVELHFKSSYFANNYDPRIQQFYKQDTFNVYEYMLINIFLNFKINNFKMSFKVGHINQGWINPGYFTTPKYPGQRIFFDMGIRWSFFD